MKVLIERTSDPCGKKPPIPEAVCIAERGGQKYYEVEVRGLTGLRKLIKQEGAVVVGMDDAGKMSVEIYDDWRE